MNKNRVWKSRLTAALVTAGLIWQPAAAMAQGEDGDAARGRDLELTVTASLETEKTGGEGGQGSGDQAESLGQLEQVLESSALHILTGTRKDKALVNLSLEVMGSTVFRALGSLDAEKLALSFPDVDEHLYTAAVSSLTEAVRRQFQEGAENLPGQIDLMQQADRCIGILTPYLETVMDFAGKTADQKEGAITLEQLGETAQGVLTVWEPDGSQLGELMEELAGQMERDEQLGQLMGEWADHAQNLGEEDAEEIRDFREEGAKSLREASKRLAEAKDDAPISLTVGRVQEKTVLVDLSLEAMTGEEGEDLQQPFSFRYEDWQGATCLLMGNGESQVRMDARHESSEGIDSGSFTFSADGRTMATGEYRFDQNSRSLLGLPYGTASVEMAGAQLSVYIGANGTGGDDHTLTISGLENTPSRFMGISGLTLNVNSAETEELEEPSGRVVDCSDYDAQEAEKLTEKLAEKLFVYGVRKWPGLSVSETESE